MLLLVPTYAHDCFRYAKQANVIVNNARVNEDPMARQIRGNNCGLRRIKLGKTIFYLELRAKLDEFRRLGNCGGDEREAYQRQIRDLQHRLTQQDRQLELARCGVFLSCSLYPVCRVTQEREEKRFQEVSAQVGSDA